MCVIEREPPEATPSSSSAASEVNKRQELNERYKSMNGKKRERQREVKDKAKRKWFIHYDQHLKHNNVRMRMLAGRFLSF